MPGDNSFLLDYTGHFFWIRISYIVCSPIGIGSSARTLAKQTICSYIHFLVKTLFGVHISAALVEMYNAIFFGSCNIGHHYQLRSFQKEERNLMIKIDRIPNYP